MARQASPVTAAIVMMSSTPVAAQPASLLEELLINAPALSAALTNVAENLGQVDTSFALSVERNFTAVSAGLEVWSNGRASAMAATGVQVAELQDGALAHLDQLALDVGQIVTTGVGSLQSADLNGSFDSSGLVERIQFSAQTASLTVENHGGIQGLIVLQNVSLNAGEIFAAADLHLADTQARLEGIGTTAIGGLQTGAINTAVDLTATLKGRMGEVDHFTSTVITALVGI